MPFNKNRRPAKKQSSPGGPGSKPPTAKGKKRLVAKPARKPSDKAGLPNIENTGQEAQYLDELIRRDRIVSVVLSSGETMQGYIRYYDRDVFSLGPLDGGPKVFLRKDGIRYLYEEEV